MRTKRYTEEQFIQAVKESTSNTQVLKKLGLSHTGGGHTTIKRYIKLLLIPINMVNSFVFS
jgi:hypothetical protein